MATFRYDQFSVTSTAQSVIKMLGMGGFGRLIRVLEDCTDNGQLALSWSDWLSMLECNRDQFDAWLSTVVELGAFTVSQGEGMSAPLMLTLGQPLRFLLAHPDPASVVFTTAAQWSDWMTLELAAPARVVTDPASQELFRRWCASNVSLAEIQQAAERAALAHDVSPVGLHEQWKTVRTERVALAYNRA